MIALDLGRYDADASSLTFEQFLATRPQWPADRPPIALEDVACLSKPLSVNEDIQDERA